jgi:biopolymer transport protein ExbD
MGGMSYGWKRRRNKQAEPMVDIAFLLLIFYMSTTQFKPPEKKSVNLPRSHSQITMSDKDVINVTVTLEDSIYVDYIIKDTVFVDGKEFLIPVRVCKEATPSSVGKCIIGSGVLNQETYLVIKADAKSSFGTMEGIIKSLQEQKLSRFQILTAIERDL